MKTIGAAITEDNVRADLLRTHLSAGLVLGLSRFSDGRGRYGRVIVSDCAASSHALADKFPPASSEPGSRRGPGFE